MGDITYVDDGNPVRARKKPLQSTRFFTLVVTWRAEVEVLVLTIARLHVRIVALVQAESRR